VAVEPRLPWRGQSLRSKNLRKTAQARWDEADAPKETPSLIQRRGGVPSIWLGGKNVRLRNWAKCRQRTQKSFSQELPAFFNRPKGDDLRVANIQRRRKKKKARKQRICEAATGVHHLHGEWRSCGSSSKRHRQQKPKTMQEAGKAPLTISFYGLPKKNKKRRGRVRHGVINTRSVPNSSVIAVTFGKGVRQTHNKKNPKTTKKKKQNTLNLRS